MNVKIYYGQNYTYQKNDLGNYVYSYENRFCATEDEINTITNKLKAVSENTNIIIPKVTVTGDIVSMEYPFSKENKYLFYSLYCRKYKITNADGRQLTKRIIGDYIRALVPETRINIAFQLCNAFQVLNSEQICIKNFNDVFILFDLEYDKVYFDFLPALLSLSKEDKNIDEKLYIEYYITDPQWVAEDVLPTYVIGKNNHYLALLLYKLLTGNSLFSSLTNTEIMQKHLLHSLSMTAQKSCFFEDLMNLLQVKPDYQPPKKTFPFHRKNIKVNEIDLYSKYRSPAMWITHINYFRCLCSHGILGLHNEKLICDKCGKELIGFAEALKNRVKVPLIGVTQSAGILLATEYTLSMLQLSNEKIILFKVLRGNDNNGNFRCALTFSLNDDICFLSDDEKTWIPFDGKNSAGTSRMYEITDKCREATIKINKEVIHFVFNH